MKDNYEIIKDCLSGAEPSAKNGFNADSTNAAVNFSQAETGSNPSVNLATGRLRYVFGDVSIGYGNFAIQVNHVYTSTRNSNFKNKFSEFGNNWKLNLSQCVVNGGADFLYMDGQGEVHRFVKFDGDRYYDECNANLVLSVESSAINKIRYNYVITDNVGNKMYFGENGLIIAAQDGHNASMIKCFVYNGNNLLTEVYDARTEKKRIRFEYDGQNKLKSAFAYSNYSKKVSGIKYEYDSNDNLQKVYKTAFNKGAEEVFCREIYRFEYGSYSNLVQIVDLQTTEAVAIKYNNEKAAEKITSGVLKQDCIAVGQNLYAGMAECGMLDNRQFIPKQSLSFFYTKGKDGTAQEVQITNEDGIKIAYFLNTAGKIVSSFEVTENNVYKTLNKQGAKHLLNASGQAQTTINGYSPLASSGSSVNVSVPSGFDLANNKAEKKYNYFQYSFWLKLLSDCPLPQAMVTYKFENNDQQQQTVYIDGKAQNVWQKVSLPVIVPNLENDSNTDKENNPQTDKLQAIIISLLSEGTFSNCDFEIIEIGFEPAPLTTSFLSDSKLYDVTEVRLTVKNGNDLQTQKKVINRNLFFTENDILATASRKFMFPNGADGCFDVICNNGTKRIGSVKTIEFKTDGVFFSPYVPYYSFFTALNTVVQLQYGNKITSLYDYNDQCVIMQTQGVNAEGTSSLIEVSVDKYGKTLYKKDEYGVKTQYGYNSFGALISEKVTDKSYAKRSALYYSYDNEGRLSAKHNGLRGETYQYDDYDKIYKITDCKVVNGKLQAMKHSIRKYYDIFNDKTTKQYENNGSRDHACTVAEYQNGLTRTVTDGVAKYGAVRYPEQDEVQYTTFWFGEGKAQTDTVTKNNEGEKTYTSKCGLNRISKTVDAYNRVKQVSMQAVNDDYESTENTFTYHYDNLTESKFASKPYKLTNGTTDVTEYFYDGSGNLTGYVQKDDDKTLMEVQQLPSGATKYKYSNRDKIYVSVEHDSEKTLNPRVRSIKYLEDFNTNFDKPEVTPLFQIDYAENEINGLPTKKTVRHKTKKGSVEDYSYITVNGVTQLEKSNYSGKCWQGKNEGNVCESKYDITYQYNDEGEITQIVRSVDWKIYGGNNLQDSYKRSYTYKYEYNDLHQLTKERLESHGADYTYDKYGRLSSVNGKQLQYDSAYNRLDIFGDTHYFYDGSGNRTKEITTGQQIKRYTYLCGLLTETNNAVYGYNQNGVRNKKVSGGITTKYILDGNKILCEVQTSEEISDLYNDDQRVVQYFYDTNGIAYIKINEIVYEAVRDALGNVVMLLDYDSGVVACYYLYDALGNCYVKDSKGDSDNNPKSIGNTNPFRWKGFYYDTETGFYYANGRYYDPKVGQYLNAPPLSDIMQTPFRPRILDRYTPICNNFMELAYTPVSAFTVTQLFADLNYADDQQPLWYLILGGALAVGSFVLAGFTVGWGKAIASTLIGGAVGAGFGALSAHITGGDIKTGAMLGMLSGIISGNTASAGGLAVGVIGGAFAGGYTEIGGQLFQFGQVVSWMDVFLMVGIAGIISLGSTLFDVMTEGIKVFDNPFGDFVSDIVTNGLSLFIDYIGSLRHEIWH